MKSLPITPVARISRSWYSVDYAHATQSTHAFLHSNRDNIEVARNPFFKIEWRVTLSHVPRTRPNVEGLHITQRVEADQSLSLVPFRPIQQRRLNFAFQIVYHGAVMLLQIAWLRVIDGTRKALVSRSYRLVLLESDSRPRPNNGNPLRFRPTSTTHHEREKTPQCCWKWQQTSLQSPCRTRPRNRTRDSRSGYTRRNAS